MKDESKPTGGLMRDQGRNRLASFFFILHPSSFILCESFILLCVGACWGASPWQKPVLTPAQSGLIVMKVEMAWISDPLTASCEVRARWMGAALEVQGRAPSEASKQRALELAQKLSPVPILDNVRIVPGQGALRMPAGGSIEDMTARLTEVSTRMGVQGLVIWADSEGRQVVSGSVGSVQEKLALSNALRELGLGGRISNRIVVRPVVRDGQLVTLVSADGRYTVLGRPNLSDSSDGADEGFLPAPSGGPSLPATVHRKPRRRTVEFASARGEETSQEGGLISAAGNEPEMPLPVHRSHGDKASEPAPSRLPSGLGESGAGMEAPHQAQMIPTPASESPISSSTRPARVREIRSERVWPPAHEIRPPTLEPRKPAALPTQLPEPGLGLAEEAEPTPATTPASPPAAYQGSPEAQQLKQSIDRLCGRFAHHIEIIEHPEGGMVVRVQVPSDALGHMLLSRLLTIPQIASSLVKLEVIVKP